MGGNKTVDDYVSLQRGITYKGKLVGGPGPALLGLGAIVPGGGFREADFKTYGGECPKNITLYPGDLFASLKGATKDGKMIGSVARVPTSVPIGRLTQDTVKLEFKEPDESFSKYLYWLLQTPQYRDYCDRHSTGSAVVALSRNDFLSYPIPELTDFSWSIVELLELQEKKIRKNQQTNRTLEQMAQALFKSWFVDFDPVIDNALLAGNPIPDELLDRAQLRQQQLAKPDHKPLPVDIRQLFPSEFELTKELGWVPEGWEAGSVGSVIENVGGGTPKTKEDAYWIDGIHAFCTPKDMSNMTSKILLNTDRCLTEAGVAKISSGILPVGTVLMSSRAPIGYLAITDIPVSVNQGIIALKQNEKYGSEYLLCWAESNMEEVVSRANGSTFLEISKKNFRDIPFLEATEEVLSAFTDIARSYFNRITGLQRQVDQLTKLRDTLLPKLISGELRLPPEVLGDVKQQFTGALA